jgi:hypothetical protein
MSYRRGRPTMTQPAIDPFDPALAGAPTTVVALARIIDPLGRHPHDPFRVEAYRTAMRSGGHFPPIAVVTWGSRYLVADGHKRFAAYVAFGRPDIRVQVWSWRRWLRDQGRQARDNAGKNFRIVRLCAGDPPAALRLLGTTLSHWQRVGAALISSVGRRTR